MTLFQSDQPTELFNLWDDILLQYFTDVYDLLSFVENDILDYIRKKLKNTTDTKPRDIHLFFEEKGAYLNALLGDYDNIRFIEKLKCEYFQMIGLLLLVKHIPINI